MKALARLERERLKDGRRWHWRKHGIVLVVLSNEPNQMRLPFDVLP
jgi:hypothetical protein